MPLLDHFGFLAPHYETFIPARLSQELLRLADLPARGFLLDAGGGTGRIAQFFLDQTDCVIVADQSLKMLQEAHKKAGVRPVCSLTERMPFADGSMARIIMVDALHHVANQPQTAVELWRILAPSGRIIIEEPDITRFSVKLMALAEKLALMRSHFLSPARIASLFRAPEAQVVIGREATTAWITIIKREV